MNAPESSDRGTTQEIQLENGYIREVPGESGLTPLQAPHREESVRWIIASGCCALAPLFALLGILHMVRVSPDDSVVFGGDFNILPGLLFILILIISTALGIGTALFGLRTRSKSSHLWIGILLLTYHLLFFFATVLFWNL